jgi:hypothetical protein
VFGKTNAAKNAAIAERLRSTCPSLVDRSTASSVYGSPMNVLLVIILATADSGHFVVAYFKVLGWLGLFTL